VRVIAAMWKREVAACFMAPLAYAVWFFFLLLMGFQFHALLQVLAAGPVHHGIMRLLMGESPFFWLAMWMLVPVITMRAFAEERRSGTLETLLTAPVTEWQVVGAKYAAALTFYAICWLPTLGYTWLLARYSPEAVLVDGGALGATYLGIGLLGAFFVAVGLLASAATRHQAVAAMITLVVLGIWFLAGFIPYYARAGGVQAVGRYMSSVLHMMEFSRGVIDSRPIVLYLTGSALALFVTVKLLEGRKWSG